MTEPNGPNPWSVGVWGDPDLAAAARAARGDVAASLRLARQTEGVATSWGSDTWRVLVALATLGAVDLTTARTVEPH